MTNSSSDLNLQSTTAALKNIFKKGQFPPRATNVAIKSEEKKSLLSIIKSEEPKVSSGSKISEPSGSSQSVPAAFHTSPSRQVHPLASSGEEPIQFVFPLEHANRLPSIKSSVDTFAISHFSSSPSSSDAAPKLQVKVVNEKFMVYLMKDGSVRIMTCSTGEKQILKSEKSFYISFCLNDQMKVCCLAKDGSIDIFAIEEEFDHFHLAKVCSLSVEPKQLYFGRLFFHPRNPNALFMTSRNGEIYGANLINLINEANENKGRIILSSLPNGTLSPSVHGVLHRLPTVGEEKIIYFSHSPHDPLFLIINSKAEMIVSSDKGATNDVHKIIPLPIASKFPKPNSSFEAFWCLESKLILCCLQNEVLLINYLEEKIVFHLKFQGIYENFHYHYCNQQNLLIVANSNLKSIMFFKIQERPHFLGVLPLNHFVTDLDVSSGGIDDSIDSSKSNIFTIYEEGFCYYSLNFSQLSQIPNESKYLIEEKEQSPVRQEISSDNLNLSSLPTIVEYAIKDQLEHLLKTKFNAFIKNCIDESFKKQTQLLEEQLKGLQIQNDLSTLTEIKQSFSLIQRDLSRLVDLIEKSSSLPPADESIQDSSEALPSVAKSSSAASIKEEIGLLIRSGKIDDAFRRVLNLKNLSLLIWLCTQFDIETFFNQQILSSPNLLSLIQQLSIDLLVDSQLKLQWLQHALFAININDQIIRKYFVQMYQVLIKNLNLFISTSSSNNNVDESTLNAAKMAIKIIEQLAKTISK